MGIVFLLTGCTPYDDTDKADASADASVDDRYGTVTAVIDGDTFMLDDGRVIDLIGVAAPTPDQRCYEAAKEDLAGLVLGYRVRIESDSREEKAPSGDGGAISRYVFIGDVLVNEQMLLLGNVWPLFDTSYTDHQSELEDAAREGRDGGTGCAWEGCVYVPWRGVIDGDSFYYVDRPEDLNDPGDVEEIRQVGQEARLLGVDTPEFNENCHDRAVGALRTYIGDKFIRVSGDEAAGKRDIYDRILVYASPCEYDAIGMINLWLVEEGMACLYSGKKIGLMPELTNAARQAELNETGCWENNPNFCGSQR